MVLTYLGYIISSTGSRSPQHHLVGDLGRQARGSFGPGAAAPALLVERAGRQRRGRAGRRGRGSRRRGLGLEQVVQRARAGQRMPLARQPPRRRLRARAQRQRRQHRRHAAHAHADAHLPPLARTKYTIYAHPVGARPTTLYTASASSGWMCCWLPLHEF